MMNIKLFEAFDSDVISNVMNFLSTKIDKKNVCDKFKKNLIKLLDLYDIPIDKISDSDLVYLNKKNALKITTDLPIDNKLGIYCIKYWFSLDDGLLGKSIICNGSFFGKSDKRVFKGNNVILSEIPEKFKTGVLMKKSIKDIKPGDIFFLKVRENEQKYTEAFLYEFENKYYALNNTHSGASPDDGNWNRKGYSYSWIVASNDKGVYKEHDDHFSVLKYIESDEPIALKSNGVEFDDVFVNDAHEIDSSVKSDDILKKSDFAIVFYLDKLLKLESVSSIRDNRYNNKLNALGLMSDYEIRNTNIERYIKKMFDDRIDKNSISVNKMVSIIRNLTSHDNVFLFIMDERDDNIFNLEKFCDMLYSLIESPGEYKDEEYDRLFAYYTKKYKYVSNANRIINNNVDKIKKSNNTLLVEIINQYLEISNYISNYIKIDNYETIDDILFLIQKIKSIRNLNNNIIFRIRSYDVKKIFDNITSDAISSIIITVSSELNEEEFELISDKIKKQFKFVKSILK